MALPGFFVRCRLLLVESRACPPGRHTADGRDARPSTVAAAWAW